MKCKLLFRARVEALVYNGESNGKDYSPPLIMVLWGWGTKWTCTWKKGLHRDTQRLGLRLTMLVFVENRGREKILERYFIF